MGNENRGRKNNMKVKTYLVYQYLLRNTDETKRLSAGDIVDYLRNDCGLETEVRAIYNDINDLNKALWLVKNNASIEDLEEAEEDGTYEKAIVYDPHAKGFYFKERGYTSFDIKMIMELINTSKYISETEAERLTDIMAAFVSEADMDTVKQEALVSNRSRTLNKATVNNVALIKKAMRKELKGDNKHIPEQISFKYLKTEIRDLNNQIERKSGQLYVVSPFKLIINDGNYYLLAYNKQKEKIITYRVDRMKDLKLTGLQREGEEEFKKIDIRTYTQRTFGMFSGNQEEVRMRFTMSSLDTVIEKLGRDKREISYVKEDEHHFRVSTKIVVSNMFYAWLCGFGTSVEVLHPQSVREGYENYLKKILAKYDK